MGSGDACAATRSGRNRHQDRAFWAREVQKENPHGTSLFPVASKDVKSALHRRKRGTLKSGGSGKTVKSRKQAIAIGLSEARKKGKKVPKKAAKKRKSS